MPWTIFAVSLAIGVFGFFLPRLLGQGVQAFSEAGRQPQPDHAKGKVKLSKPPATPKARLKLK